jgi:hypothetical protein
MSKFTEVLSKLEPGTIISIRVKKGTEPTNGEFHNISPEGVVELGTMVLGTKKQVRQTYDSISEMFGGYVPNRTYLHVDDIKNITILEKYAKKESKDKRQETDEDS